MKEIVTVGLSGHLVHSSLLAQKKGKRKRLDFTPNFNQHSRFKLNRVTIPLELFHFIRSSQPKPRIANMVLLTKHKDRDTLNKQTSKDSISFSTPTFCLGLASTSSAESLFNVLPEKVQGIFNVPFSYFLA